MVSRPIRSEAVLPAEKKGLRSIIKHGVIARRYTSPHTHLQLIRISSPLLPATLNKKSSRALLNVGSDILHLGVCGLSGIGMIKGTVENMIIKSLFTHPHDDLNLLFIYLL